MSRALCRSRDAQGVRDGSAREHRDSEAYCLIKVRKNGMFRVRIDARVDDHDFIHRRVELGTDGEQGERA